ncbi:hypothetical protein R0381_002667 [Jeongeupia wiesaeckerbachi]|uniref:hypothetical protein n=1 Tax=Jeongeupia wiesaeckerbachi TaxID=3051218 RepID=UPI003D805C24
MRKAYSFNARGTCTSTGKEIDALCVFFDTKHSMSELVFFDELDESLPQLKTLPDCVVIIADETNLVSLQENWTTSTAQQHIFQQRGMRKNVPFIKSYYFVAWDPTAGLSVKNAHGSGGAAANFTLPIDSFISQGLHGLIDSNPVVQIAPAGHVFRHPSKTVNKLFIQARELATCEVELAFVGRCLAHRLKALTLPQLSTVFIDSMGIYSIVREALTFANSRAVIHSFHSYAELSELSPPTEPYAVVISASTSGGMARTLHSDQRFDDERILTLIDTTRSGRTGNVLIALDDLTPSYRKPMADGTETQIEIFGEHFSSKAKPPRAVTLGMPHEPKPLRKFLTRFGRQGLVNLNTQPAGRLAPRLVCLDSNVVASDTELLTWLKHEIDWRVSVAIDHIIHAGDTGSQTLAEAAANVLQAAKGSAIRPAIISYTDLTDTILNRAKGVLVVHAVAGDGGLLREISRDLREFLTSDVPRHFLAGVGLPQSEETWQRLQQFLVRNPSTREYGFSTWLVLPIGSEGTVNAWQGLSKCAEKAQMELPSVSGVSKSILTQSVDLAVQSIRDADNGFLPTSSGASLSLSDGFLFFGDVFNGTLNDVPESTTYTTVASVLQAARDMKVPANQLKPNGYESVVLSPENFLRFNDNLLQACILRAAHPSELDYSSSPHLSCLMKEFLLKVFSRHDHAYGAASLEFAAALACGRMKLIAEDRNEVQQKALEKLSSGPSALLGLVCLMA